MARKSLHKWRNAARYELAERKARYRVFAAQQQAEVCLTEQQAADAVGFADFISKLANREEELED